MSTKITDGVYKIEVPMWGPLQCLNAYLVLGNGYGKNLVVDVGFDNPESLGKLTADMAELGADFTNTDIFLTHMHHDHAEAAAHIKKEHPEVKIYIGENDGEYIRLAAEGKMVRWNWTPDQLVIMGFDDEFLKGYEQFAEMRKSKFVIPTEYVYVHEGDVLEYGGHKLLCVDGAGHSPGMTCLYMAEKKLMFLGDHVLFDITPGIATWTDGENPLETYLKNVEKIKNYDIEIPLPAHRGAYCSASERVDEILAHHKARLAEAEDVLRKIPGATPYQVAAGLTWNVKGGDWSKFTVDLRLSAVGETIAHLAYFMGRGIARRETINGVWHFYLNEK